MLGPKHPDVIASQFDLIELLQLVGDEQAAAQVLSFCHCVAGTTVQMLEQLVGDAKAAAQVLSLLLRRYSVYYARRNST